MESVYEFCLFALALVGGVRTGVLVANRGWAWYWRL